jgi:dolichol-phosphate mannosyltransferase
MFYRLINALTDTDIPLDTGDFRLMDRAVVDVMNRMGEHHRFIRGMVSWVGYKQIGIEYDRKERYAGETKYPLKKMLNLAMTAITGFSNVPLRLASYTGFISAAISIIFIPIVIIMRMLGNQAFFGQATTLIAVLFLGGAQLMALGILGEYIGRLYDEGRNRPLYITRETPEDFEKYHSEK